MRVPRVVNAHGFVRRMRGGCRAQLIEGDDGAGYVVKFAGNPQGGQRTLINETIASVLFDEVQIATPEAVFVAVGREFLEQHAALIAEARIVIQPGLHFGSRIPDVAGAGPVSDFLPDRLLSQLHNRQDFLGALVLDKWLSNGDSRQAVFHQTSGGWRVEMIDHGGIFQGKDWTFRNSPAQAVYGRRAVYGTDPCLGDFDPWLDAIAKITPTDLEEVLGLLPREWVDGEESQLRDVLRVLYARRDQTRRLVRESIDCFWSRSRSYSSLVLPFRGFPLRSSHAFRG